MVFQLGDEDMDSFVLALGKKKPLLKMQKEYEDLVGHAQLSCSHINIPIVFS